MRLLVALAAIAVVAGHLDPSGFAGPFGIVPPYSWQVAAFVFVSGYFYRPSAEDAPLRYIVRKFRRLIVPLLGINLVYGITCQLLRTLGVMEVGEPLSASSLLVLPFTSGHQFVLNSAMWFLAPLFSAEVANVLIRRVVRSFRDSTVKESLLFLMYLLLGSAAVIIGGPDGMQAGFALAVCRTAFFLSLLGMGRLYRAVLEPHDTLSSTLYFLIAVALQLLTMYVAGEQVVYNSAWCRFYHGPVLTYLTTACSLAIMLRACRILGPLLGASKPVRLLHEGSFSVMSHHLAGCLMLTLAIGASAAAFGFPASFDFGALHGQGPWYFFMPGGLRPFALTYAACGIGFSLAVHACWLWVKYALHQLMRHRDEARR